jgi:hypothetical protein
LNDYLLLMHDDAGHERADQWPVWLDRLAGDGRLRGGSSMAGGECVRQGASAQRPARTLTGFVRIVAADLDDAKACLIGNPVYEGGGTVEIHLLTEDDT